MVVAGYNIIARDAIVFVLASDPLCRENENNVVRLLLGSGEGIAVFR